MALKATALFAMLGLSFVLSPSIEANVDPHFDNLWNLVLDMFICFLKIKA